MKKIILLLYIVLSAAGCSNMMIDLEHMELKSGENILLSGTAGTDVTGTAVDINKDGTPDGIDTNGDGTVDFTFIPADSAPASGLYAADTNGDGMTDIYISISATGTSTINTAPDGTGEAVTIAVDSDGTTSFSGADVPTGSSPGTGTDPGAGTPSITATTDINGDGTVDAADTALLAKLTFTVTGDTVTITGADSDIPGELNIPAEYDGKAVTSIGDSAFDSCTSLTSVTIPDSVTSVGEQAFANCSGLTSASIPDSVTSLEPAAFKSCTSLTTVTITSTITTIGMSAFQACTSLTSITIPAGVTTIASSAFSGCTSLTSLTMLPDPAPTAAADILAGIPTAVSLTYPDGATGYDDAGTVWVDTSVLLKEGDWNADGTVNSADMDLITFSWNESGAYIQRVSTSITGSLIIPSTHDGRSLYWINDNAFEGCTSLTSVTIPESVKIIGDDAFRDCSSLTTASISEGVTTLGINVFWGCTLLSDVTLPESLLSIGEKVFYECSSLETLTLPSGITSIGSGIFIRCISLTSIIWPPLVETIADFTFSGCDSLTSFEVPSTVTTLAGGAFRDCTLLTSLTIPSSVTSLGAYLIYNSPVKILTMLHSVPPSIVSTTFYELSGCTLRHPDVLTFNKDPWNNTTIFSTVDTF